MLPGQNQSGRFAYVRRVVWWAPESNSRSKHYKNLLSFPAPVSTKTIQNREQIVEETKNENVHVLLGDLSLASDVRRVVDEVRQPCTLVGFHVNRQPGLRLSQLIFFLHLFSHFSMRAKKPS